MRPVRSLTALAGDGVCRPAPGPAYRPGPRPASTAVVRLRPQSRWVAAANASVGSLTALSPPARRPCRYVGAGSTASRAEPPTARPDRRTIPEGLGGDDLLRHSPMTGLGDGAARRRCGRLCPEVGAADRGGHGAGPAGRGPDRRREAGGAPGCAPSQWRAPPGDGVSQAAADARGPDGRRRGDPAGRRRWGRPPAPTTSAEVVHRASLGAGGPVHERAVRPRLGGRRTVDRGGRARRHVAGRPDRPRAGRDAGRDPHPGRIPSDRSHHGIVVSGGYVWTPARDGLFRIDAATTASGIVAVEAAWPGRRWTGDGAVGRSATTTCCAGSMPARPRSPRRRWSPRWARPERRGPRLRGRHRLGHRRRRGPAPPARLRPDHPRSPLPHYVGPPGLVATPTSWPRTATGS